MVRREILAVLKANKKGQISKTGEATPTKIGFHALYEIFEPILFFDPNGLYSLSKERTHKTKEHKMKQHKIMIKTLHKRKTQKLKPKEKT